MGSSSRILHGLLLGLLQPIVPMVMFAGLAPLLFSEDRTALKPRPLTFLVVAAVGAGLLAVLVGGGVLKIGRIGPAELGFRRGRTAIEVVFGVLGLIVYLACFAAIVHALLPDPGRIVRHVLSQSAGERLLFLFVGLTIAIFEESVFRGYLQPALVHRLGLGFGVILTAIIFAAWHPIPKPPHFSFPGFLVRLSLGLITGLSRGRDRPLTAAITTHALIWPVLGLT